MATQLVHDGGLVDVEHCPFCRQPGFYRGFSGKECRSIGWIECSGCGAKGPSCQHEESALPAAVDAWNRRAG
jgi:transcription elongation factor Elf1